MGYGSVKINLNKGKAQVFTFDDVVEKSNITLKGDSKRVTSCLVSILLKKDPSYRKELLKQLGVVKDESTPSKQKRE